MLLSQPICLLKVNNKITRTRCEVYSKLTTKTTERRWDELKLHLNYLLFKLFIIFIYLFLRCQNTNDAFSLLPSIFPFKCHPCL